MNKFVLILLLAGASSSAMAEWESLPSTPDGITLYKNPTTIRKNGDKVKMWILFDNKTSEIIGKYKRYLSAKTQFEFDCKEEQYRPISIIAYSENMGKGEPVYSYDNPTEWSSVVPETINEFLWKYACGKK